MYPVMLLPPLLLESSASIVNDIEDWVTSVTIGGLTGYWGIVAAITTISELNGPSPITLTADTLNLYVEVNVKFD